LTAPGRSEPNLGKKKWILWNAFPSVRVIPSLLLKHGNEGSQQPIGYTTQGPAVAVT